MIYDEVEIERIARVAGKLLLFKTGDGWLPVENTIRQKWTSIPITGRPS